MKKLRHESAVLNCLLRARCAETLASRHEEEYLLNVEFENICELHKQKISRQRYRNFINQL